MFGHVFGLAGVGLLLFVFELALFGRGVFPFSFQNIVNYRFGDPVDPFAAAPATLSLCDENRTRLRVG